MKIIIPVINPLSLMKSMTTKTKSFGNVMRTHKLAVALLLILIPAAIFLGNMVWGYVGANKPTIKLIVPEENIEVIGEDLLVKGTVTPVVDKVMVNDNIASLNGDGLFTAIIKIQPGINTLKIKASKGIQEAEVLNIVVRKLSPEEEAAQEKSLLEKQKEETVHATTVDQKIAEINALYENNTAKKIKVVNSAIETQGTLKRITGEVINDSGKPVKWVKVTASFFDDKQNLIDSKIGFVVSNNEILQPNARGSFKTQTIQVPFINYKLDVKWEDEVGNDTGKTATGSAKLLP